jgi:hypothetical protein
MLVRWFFDQLIIEFAFASLVIFVQSAQGHNSVPNDRLLLPRFEKKRFPEPRLGSTRKGRDCANLEAMEDATLLGITWKCCRD